MKLIIDIDENLYSYILQKDAVYFPDDGGKLFEAVKNSTPLPKEHGDLIDADKMIEELNERIHILDEGRNEIFKQLGEPEENNQIPLWMWKGCCKTCGIIIESDKTESEE